MCLLEALESTESPHTFVVLLFVLVGAFGHFDTHFGFVTALAQLFDQTINIESGIVVEQAHFVQNATHVAASFLVIGEVPFLVFGDGFFGDVQRLGTHWSVTGEIILGLDAPFVGGDLQGETENIVFIRMSMRVSEHFCPMEI